MNPDELRREFPKLLLSRGPALRMMERCGVSRRLFQRWCAEGRVQAQRLPGHQWKHYRREELLTLVKEKI